MAETSVEIKGLDIITKKWGQAVLKLADTSGLMKEIGIFLQYSLPDRVERGVDVNEVPFEPYSASYEQLRAAKELPTSVDLFFTGQMLSSLTYESTKDVTRLFFMDTPRRASDRSKSSANVWGKGGDKHSNAEIAYYVNEIREFFGISAEEMEAVSGMVEDFIANIMIRKV